MNKKGTKENLIPGGADKKIFKSADEFMQSLYEFGEYIRSIAYLAAPFKHEYCKWAGMSIHTLYNYLNRYFPQIKEEWEKLLGEILAEGAMLGHYQPTMTIFVMKNWCGMTDKQETTANVELHGSLEDALDSLPDD